MNVRYHINNEAYKGMFAKTGSNQKAFTFEVEWLDLSVEDRTLLVDLFGVQNTYNVSYVQKWLEKEMVTRTDYIHEYPAIFGSVEALMDSARVVLEQAREVAQFERYVWVAKQINFYQNLIEDLYLWRSEVSRWTAEDEYEEHVYKLEALNKVRICLTVEEVLDAYGNNLADVLSDTVNEYRQLVDKIRNKHKELYEICVDNVEVDKKLAYFNERDRWVEAYGSLYLRGLLKEGYQFDEVYLSERIGAEYRGWEIYNWSREDTVPSSEQLELAKTYGARVYQDRFGKRFMAIDGYLGKHTIVKWFTES